MSVHRLARVRQPQREQEALGHLSVQAHPQIGEVDLGLRAGRMALRHEPGHHPGPGGVPGGRLRHQLRTAAVHVLRDIGVRHPGVVLGLQPREDPPGGVPLLARRGQVLDQHRVDHLAHRVEHQRAPRRALARRRDRRGDRLPHRAPMHRILLRQRPDRHLVALPVEPDRRVELHPRPHPGPCDIERTDEHRQIHDPPEPAHHRATRRRVADRHHRGWGQSRVLRPHRHRPEVGPEPRRTVGPVQSATANLPLFRSTTGRFARFSRGGCTAQAADLLAGTNWDGAELRREPRRTRATQLAAERSGPQRNRAVATRFDKLAVALPGHRPHRRPGRVAALIDLKRSRLDRPDPLAALSAPTRRMNRLRLTGTFPATACLGLGDLLVDPAQRAPGPIGPVLVVDDLVTALVSVYGRPGLGQDQSVGRLLVGMLRGAARSARRGCRGS